MSAVMEAHERTGTPDDYFDRMYGGSDDPWDYARRWYERRKRGIVMAALPHPRYGRAFEPACSTGELTRLLAARCDTVVASDLNASAVATAAQRLGGMRHVSLGQARMPDEWPDGVFDLVVLSELAYYLDDARITALGTRAATAAADGGTIVACHWRHAVREHATSGDAAHALLDAAICGQRGFRRLACWQDADFLLDVWSADPRSVAAREGLT